MALMQRALPAAFELISEAPGHIWQHYRESARCRTALQPDLAGRWPQRPAGK